MIEIIMITKNQFYSQVTPQLLPITSFHCQTHTMNIFASHVQINT